MKSWAEFERDDPALAPFGRERLQGRVVFQATLRADGSPRVHPVSPWFGAGLLVVSCRLRSPKVEEFARDGRYAMHSALPSDDHEGAAGEFLLSGWMERLSEVHPAAVARPFEGEETLAFWACGLEEAVATTYEDDAPVYLRWRA